MATGGYSVPRRWNVRYLSVPDPELANIAPQMLVPHALPGLHRQDPANQQKQACQLEPGELLARPSVPWGPDRRATTTAALLREIYVDVERARNCLR